MTRHASSIIALLAAFTFVSPALAVLDAELGRWMTRDPMKYVDGSSLASYVNQNPLARRDSSGLLIDGWNGRLQGAPCGGFTCIHHMDITMLPNDQPFWVMAKITAVGQCTCCNCDDTYNTAFYELWGWKDEGGTPVPFSSSHPHAVSTRFGHTFSHPSMPNTDGFVIMVAEVKVFTGLDREDVLSAFPLPPGSASLQGSCCGNPFPPLETNRIGMKEPCFWHKELRRPLV